MTHGIAFLPQVDQIIVLQDGRISEVWVALAFIVLSYQLHDTKVFSRLDSFFKLKCQLISLTTSFLMISLNALFYGTCVTILLPYKLCCTNLRKSACVKTFLLQQVLYRVKSSSTFLQRLIKWGPTIKATLQRNFCVALFSRRLVCNTS